MSERGFYYTSITRDFVSCKAKSQIDLLVKPNIKKMSKIVYNWKDIKVIGEFKESNKDKKVILLQISRYVHDVFSCQLTRQYMHAFTFYRNRMRS